MSSRKGEWPTASPLPCHAAPQAGLPDLMCLSSFPSAGHSGPKAEAEKRETSEKVSPRGASTRIPAPGRSGAAPDGAREVARIPRASGQADSQGRGR